MKKIYQAPVTKEHKLQLSHVICVSGTLDSTQNITERNAIGSRRSNDFWDDEE